MQTRSSDRHFTGQLDFFHRHQRLNGYLMGTHFSAVCSSLNLSFARFQCGDFDNSRTIDYTLVSNISPFIVGDRLYLNNSII